MLIASCRAGVKTCESIKKALGTFGPIVLGGYATKVKAGFLAMRK